MEILVAIITQLFFTVGIVFLFGFLIAQCNKAFYKKIGYGKACYITGFIGTPIHECAHALMCIIFGHKIKEIKLFQVSSDDGTLGYVKHSYNPKNIYQRIGGLFIGTAPIFVGALLIGLIRRLLLPGMDMPSLEASTGLTFQNIVQVTIDTLSSFFYSISSWQFWVFIIASSFISTHMTLSSADIKNSTAGLVFYIIAIAVMNIICFFIGKDILYEVTSFFTKVGSALLSYLILALFISLVSVLIAFIIGTIIKKVRRR